jgi:hypothetical protein
VSPLSLFFLVTIDCLYIHPPCPVLSIHQEVLLLDHNMPFVYFYTEYIVLPHLVMNNTLAIIDPVCMEDSFLVFFQWLVHLAKIIRPQMVCLFAPSMLFQLKYLLLDTLSRCSLPFGPLFHTIRCLEDTSGCLFDLLYSMIDRILGISVLEREAHYH